MIRSKLVMLLVASLFVDLSSQIDEEALLEAQFLDAEKELQYSVDHQNDNARTVTVTKLSLIDFRPH